MKVRLLFGRLEAFPFAVPPPPLLHYTVTSPHLTPRWALKGSLLPSVGAPPCCPWQAVISFLSGLLLQGGKLSLMRKLS